MDQAVAYEPSRDGFTDQCSLDNHLNSEPGDPQRPVEYLVPPEEISGTFELQPGPEQLITQAESEIKRGRDQLGLELLLQAEGQLQAHSKPPESAQKLLSAVWIIIARYYSQ